MDPTGYPYSITGFAQDVAPDGWEANDDVPPAFSTEQFIVVHHDQGAYDAWPELAAHDYVQPEWPEHPASSAAWWHQSTPPTHAPELSEDGSITPLRLPSPALPVPAGNGYPPVGNYYQTIPAHHGYQLAGNIYQPAGNDAWSTGAQDGHYAESAQASTEATFDHALPSAMNQFSNVCVHHLDPL